MRVSAAHRADAVVVGPSVALELARQGREVVVLDKAGGIGHGSTSASSTIVRFNYSTWSRSRWSSTALLRWSSAALLRWSSAALLRWSSSERQRAYRDLAEQLPKVRMSLWARRSEDPELSVAAG